MSKLRVHYFGASPIGTEMLLAGITVDWSVMDRHGITIASGRSDTDNRGWLRTPIESAYVGRVTIHISTDVNGTHFTETLTHWWSSH